MLDVSAAFDELHRQPRLDDGPAVEKFAPILDPGDPAAVGRQLGHHRRGRSSPSCLAERADPGRLAPRPAGDRLQRRQLVGQPGLRGEHRHDRGLVVAVGVGRVVEDRVGPEKILLRERVVFGVVVMADSRGAEVVPALGSIG